MGATGVTMASFLHILLGVMSLSVVVVSSLVGDSMSEVRCQTLLSSPNPVPPDMLPWYCVCHQCPGNRGTKGDLGDRGLPGIPGSLGRGGLTGPRGPPGVMGRQGIKGQKGDEGLKGQKGGDGPMGPQGTRGFKGDKGDRGGEGHPGDQGSKGNDGLCLASCEATQGPPGTQGISGAAGRRGTSGLTGSKGAKGAKGDMGSIGIPGTPGSVGEKGDQGAEGVCDCHDGEPGSQGQNGDKGAQGVQGQTGSVGQKGSQGEKGDLGLLGIRGPPGHCMPSIQSSFSAELNVSYPPPGGPVPFIQRQNFARCLLCCGGVNGGIACPCSVAPWCCLHHKTNTSTALSDNNTPMQCKKPDYDCTSGIYTAPINGTYIFNYHLTVFRRPLKVGIFRNYQPVLKTTSVTELGTTSQQVILHLNRGDIVYLMVKDDVTNGMYTSSEMSSTFSGFLLHPDTCDEPTSRDFGLPPPVPVGEYKWGDESISTVTPPTGH